MAERVRKAKITDYIELQGGVPQIWEEPPGLFHIKHAYLDDQPEVTTHISPDRRGTVIIKGVEYEVAKVWQFEGAPCERRSRSVGGRGYNRSR